MVPVAVLADLLDAAVEVAQHGVEVDDLLAVDLEDDAQHAVRGGVLRAQVDEHLAVLEPVELGLALGARRQRRDGVVDGGRRLDHHLGVVQGADLLAVGGHAGSSPLSSSRGGRAGAHGQQLAVGPDDRTGAGAGAHDRLAAHLARRQRRLHVADALARPARGVIGHGEVLAQGEGQVVGRHVDAAQVAVALEVDAEHVVGLALAPFGTGPQEGDRGHARVLAGQAVGDDAQPVGRERAPEVVDDLHGHAGVDAADVGQQLEAQVAVLAQRAHDQRHRGRLDDQLDGVAHGLGGHHQMIAEAFIELAEHACVRGSTPGR